MQMMYNFQHQNTHQQQHAQHHPNLQQDHNAHATNGLGHHTSYSSGVLSNSTPSFTPSNLQNGHAGATRGGQAQQINEHWAEQLKQHKDAEKIHQAMVEQGAPNHFARVRAGENKGIQATPPAAEITNPGEEGEKDPARMAETSTIKRRQDWVNLDLSGQGLRVLGSALFNFDFLSELYISSNKLNHLPSSIGRLRHLRHLDASNNQLTELPPELGMCVFLENLLLFDNQLRTLPNELGSLHKLEMLGIEGNRDLDPELRQEIMERGTVALITHLRETAPGN
jgi:CCR4-NOT transcription complex subunit 6